MSSSGRPGPEVSTRLGYLFKHAQLRMAELTGQELAPYGINGRELAVLLVLSSREPASQHQAAQRLGIDRTTMVGLLDALQAKGLVSRHPDVDDRRRNVVELTGAGQDTLERATAAAETAERRFLAPLSREDAEHLRGSLHVVVAQQAAPEHDAPLTDQ